MELKDTIKLMESNDYKERLKGEYYQTKIRYEKLKSYCNKIEAEEMINPTPIGKKENCCPFFLLRDQQRVMGEYLHCLELRAIIEGIEL